MKKIIHIITGLGSGGAENMLYKILKNFDKQNTYHEVISLTGKGVFGYKIEDLGIKIHYLNLNKNNLIKSTIKMKNICKDFDIIDSWLYHADFFSFIVGKILLKKKLIWNIRHSNLDKDANKSRTLKIVRLNSVLSKFVDLITYNSNKAYSEHIKFGYSDKHSKIIPNGFELNDFKFSKEERVKIRKELNINNEKVLITIGRWNIQKDYYTLLKALHDVSKTNISYKMIFIGTNLDYKNKELVNLIKKYDLCNNVILLGRQSNIPGYLSSADIYISSSLGESFSNSIGEAMACELFCIVTDVGDSALIVGNTGIVIQPRNYKELSTEIVRLLEQKEISRSKESRERILKEYDIKDISGLFLRNYI